MLGVIVVVIMLTAGIVFCASIVPIIIVLVEKIKHNRTKIVYKFSKELFDAEYSKCPNEEDQFIGRFDMDFLEFRNHYD